MKAVNAIVPLRPTPTRYALVPERMTPEMHMALLAKVSSTDGDGHWTHPDAGYEAAIAASPNGGCVTAEMLERAARARVEDYYKRTVGTILVAWDDYPEEHRRLMVANQRAALTALGLTVADAPAGEMVDG